MGIYVASDTAVVLVVEDETIIRMMLVGALEDAGFRVVEAENADDAVAQLETCSEINVVITDVRMPGSMDGLGLARWMRRERATIPIIITSGFATPPNVGEINPAIMRLVPKPYQPHDAPRWITATRAAENDASSGATSAYKDASVWAADDGRGSVETRSPQT